MKLYLALDQAVSNAILREEDRRLLMRDDKFGSEEAWRTFAWQCDAGHDSPKVESDDNDANDANDDDQTQSMRSGFQPLQINDSQTAMIQDAQINAFYYSQLRQDALHDSEATRIRDNLRTAYRATVLDNDRIRAQFRAQGQVESMLASIELEDVCGRLVKHARKIGNMGAFEVREAAAEALRRHDLDKWPDSTLFK